MILIQCTDSKRDEPVKAKKLYDTSSYFRKMRDYAEATGEIWFILSAKHGLVDPEGVIHPYDERGLSGELAESIAETIANGPHEYVEICAGKDYTDPLVPELEQRQIDVLELCPGMKIGEREEKLQEKTNRIIHDTL
jgi:hypothetical protein